MRLDVLLDQVPAAVGAAVSQAVGGLRDGAWTTEAFVDVVPLEVASGSWVEVAAPLVGTIGLGVVDDKPALRAPTALLWLMRRHLPPHAQQGEGGHTQLVFDVAKGNVAWAVLPVGGRLGLRVM